ncbi:major capsid protein [Amycolatopsis sp. FU40]|uniref:major capsid protein n=1 Tax=Amycolatopsis sp. FU40 TaxID=2914159 RepID=UPI001F1D0CCD|nr:major capsid protein [Amycolatopsis sp. FU40]UKD55148.1 major capsid protein [Amycolatopsis sp. FU40]
MLINTDYITPVELTGYVRAAFADLQVNQFTLSQYLPNQLVDDLDFRLSRGGAGLVEAGEFRTYDAESPIGSRPGIARISGELPPLSRKIRQGEYDRLRQRKLNDAIRQAILNDALSMTRALSARMELARGDALVNGSVTINENGLNGFVVDFGRKASHSVTAATLWSNTASATPVTDMMSWRDTYVATNGTEPGIAVTSRRVIAYLMQNAQFRNLVFPGANQPSLVTQQMLQDALAAFGLPPIRVYDAQVSVNKTAQRVIPDDRFLFLPPDSGDTQLGRTMWGTTAESLEAEFGLSGNEPGMVAGVYTEKDPVALWTKAAAIGLPVLANPDLSFVADVA